MIENSEELIPLAKAGRHMPLAVQPPHISTCIRWAMRGVGNPRVKLETLKVGRRRFTSKAAIERFIARLTSGELVRELATSQRHKRHQTAGDELDRAGIG